MSKQRGVLILAALCAMLLIAIASIFAGSDGTQRFDTSTSTDRIKNAAMAHCDAVGLTGLRYAGQKLYDEDDGWYQVSMQSADGDVTTVFVLGSSVYTDTPIVRDKRVEKSLSEEMTESIQSNLGPDTRCLAFVHIYGVPHQEWAEGSTVKNVQRAETLTIDVYLAVAVDMGEPEAVEVATQLSNSLSDDGFVGTIHALGVDNKKLPEYGRRRNQSEACDFWDGAEWVRIPYKDK